MKLEDIRKGATVRHADHGLATVKRILKHPRTASCPVTIEFTTGPRAGQWYDANPARLEAVQ